MNHISFGGIKNTGFLYVTSPQTQKVKTEKGMVEIPQFAHLDLHAELTNENSKDLDTFQSVLKEYPNKTNPNAVHITQDDFLHNGLGLILHSVKINDKDLDVNDKTLNNVIKLFNLTKKMSETEFPKKTIDDSYKYSLDIINDYKLLANQFIFQNYNGEYALNPEFYDEVDTVCNANSVKTGSNYFKDMFSSILQKFFEEN